MDLLREAAWKKDRQIHCGSRAFKGAFMDSTDTEVWVDDTLIPHLLSSS